jgi:hypothetical protein
MDSHFFSILGYILNGSSSISTYTFGINLDTAELDPGIYILKITLDDGQQFVVQIEIR